MTPLEIRSDNAGASYAVYESSGSPICRPLHTWLWSHMTLERSHWTKGVGNVELPADQWDTMVTNLNAGTWLWRLFGYIVIDEPDFVGIEYEFAVVHSSDSNVMVLSGSGSDVHWLAFSLRARDAHACQFVFAVGDNTVFWSDLGTGQIEGHSGLLLHDSTLNVVQPPIAPGGSISSVSAHYIPYVNSLGVGPWMGVVPFVHSMQADMFPPY